MKKDSSQKELFKEFEEAAGRKTASYVPKRHWKTFTITYENLILSAIGILMVLIIVFSLGVERGRRMEPMVVNMSSNLIEPVSVLSAEGEKESMPIKKSSIEKVEKKREKEEGEEKKQLKSKKEEIYTIQIITYGKRALAQREMARWIKKGYKPFIIPRGRYFQVCIGNYSTKNEALKNMDEFRKIYRDCFVKKIEGN